MASFRLTEVPEDSLRVQQVLLCLREVQAALAVVQSFTYLSQPLFAVKDNASGTGPVITNYTINMVYLLGWFLQ